MTKCIRFRLLICYFPFQSFTMTSGMLWKISFLLLWIGSSQTQQFPNLEFIMPPAMIEPSLEKWRDIINEQLQQETGTVFDLTSLIHNIFASLKSSSFPTAVAHNISQQCLEDSQLYVHNLYRNQSLWSLQMLESTAKLPPGLFGSNNIHADGLFDECLAVRAPGFNGQYCTVFVKAKAVDQSEILPASEELFNENHEGRSNFITIFQILDRILGSDRIIPKTSVADSNTYVFPSTTFCLPSSCSAADLGQAVAELIGSYVIGNYSFVTVTDEQYCFKANDDPPPFDGATITVIVLLSLVGFLVASATIHEAWRMYRGTNFDVEKDGKLISALHCFSVLNNGRKILSMTVSSSNDNFGCIHGLRFISTCWVVLAHSFQLVARRIMNKNALKEDFQTFGMQTIGNSTVSVDTFFLMSGLLASFLLLRELDRNKGKFNVGLYYLHRYLRLTIVYAFILGFIATLIVYVGTGPNWYTVNLFSNNCRNAWWRQFLYINNLFPQDVDYVYCMGQTWYLAVDMQLFVVSPLFIYPLWRWRKWGLTWLAFWTLACQASIFYVYARDDLPPTCIFTRADSLINIVEYFDHYYYKPWTRAPVYLVGIWTGWYLYVTKESQISRLSKPLVALGWTLSAVVGLAIVYGLYPYVDPSEVPEISSLLKMTYGPLHRTAWACVIAWVIFACSRGYGGFVNRLLSWKGFLPLGRLCYCVYLIHYDFLNVYYSAMRKQFYYTLFEQFTACFGFLVFSFGISFVVSVTLEASFLNLEKLIFYSKPKGNIDYIIQNSWRSNSFSR
uniref:Nose resistant-to-fluoxetine protein N-terminal domain-containing protein n=1 Tax=Daphnia galeata TaxID=27404 RepID=A0A8J2RU61_9CRUS|nr:unnamed protein product [Daphnia galeata]